ncbi:MAG: HU family DNA-binding protein [Prevotella sp.]|nr:HU family DNA-binding protein [Prevotella sp.]
MAVLINVRQDNRKNSNKLFYGKVIHPSTVDLNGIAEQITNLCTVTKADVQVVLTELIEVMNYELANSNKILLDNFGYFSVGIKSSGSLTKDEWNIPENLKNFHINFQSTRNTTNHKVTNKALGFGYKYKILDLVEKPKQEEDDGE